MNKAHPKVLFLADGLANGGAERQLALLVKFLPPEWERRVWSLDDGPFTDIIRNVCVPVDINKRAFRFDIRPVYDLWRILREWNPDVVHSWSWLSSAIVGPMCRILRIPWIDGSIRIGWVAREHVIRARIAFLLADRVIANSKAGLDAWDIPQSKGRVVYNGLDPERISLHAENNKTPSRDSFIVVMAARMSPVKDFLSFIEAARIVTKSNDNFWRFLVIGNGSQRSALIENAKDMINKGVMAFPDAGLEVFPFLREANVGVLMTNPALGEEGCSNTILEYMAYGLPVVCSDSGGNREVIIEGKTGFIVPPLNPKALADKLIWLRDKPDVLLKMGEAGKDRVFKEFTVQNLVQKTVDIYEELLHMRRKQKICIIGDWIEGQPDEGIHNFTLNLSNYWKTEYDVESLDVGVDLPVNRLFLSCRMFREIRTSNPDKIFYISSSCAKTSALFRAKVLKAYTPKTKIFVIALQPVDYSSFEKKLLPWLSPDGVFVQSPSGMELMEYMTCPVHFLPSGVDTNRFTPVTSDETKTDLRRKYGIDEHAFVVLHVGHINSNRNIGLLKSVVGIGDIKVIMVGSTSTPQDRDMMQNMRSSDVMVMTDYIPHIEEIYQLADAYLFPVVYDDAAIGVPLSVLEAMSCNLPIITTRFGGLPIMFREEGGLFYFAIEEELPGLITKVKKLEMCSTRQMVAAYDWRDVAETVLTLAGAENKHAVSTSKQ